MAQKLLLTQLAAPSETEAAVCAEDFRLENGQKSYTVIPIYPHSACPRNRGASVHMVSSSINCSSRGKSVQVNKQRQDNQSKRHNISQKQPPLQHQVHPDQDFLEKSYYGGESLWNKDILEDISMVSYRATHMTTSVRKLFSEISPNARPLRRGETRDLIYQKQARYEADMLADFRESRRPERSMSTSLGSTQLTLQMTDTPITTNRNTEGSSSTLGVQLHNRSVSKKAVVRDKLELFPRSRASSKISHREVEKEKEESTADTVISTISNECRPGSTSSGTRTRLFASDRILAHDEVPPPTVTFRRAFLHAKHYLSQWIKYA